MERACSGDRRALEELCRGEWPAVYRIVAASVGGGQPAEDLTQEVFLRALRRLPHYVSDSDSIRPYLVTVAQNLMRDRWRRERRVAWADVELGSLETHEAGPETATLAAERRAELVAALGRLPALYRTVLRLRLLEGRSAAEAAALLDRSPGAVRQLQRRALMALRDEFAVTADEQGGVANG